MIRILLMTLSLCLIASGQNYRPVSEKTPQIAQEFRAAWIATAYNIDWPSNKGLSAAQQQAELRRILDTVKSLNMNAVMFQVRPMGDAFYKSSIEPWSHFMSGTMGQSPGYDPLEFCISEAHARGIEVHAWFNPFRTKCNNDIPASRNHITRTQPGINKKYGTVTWLDPASSTAQAHSLKVILDVVKRYDIDGVHLDDYFYPYPKGGKSFPDGKSPAQRRAYIDRFIEKLYTTVKAEKPWVRVGISPFGIWKPGVPSGIEAGLNAYEDLAGDSRKWLQKGWVDYLSPQLYWRISPKKQSFPDLLEWWRNQGTRPVWPGIATQRINGPEDGRPTSEIIKQIDLTRKIGRNWHGHVHWSVKSLVNNQGGISKQLAGVYTQPAAVPPMPWISNEKPNSPMISASVDGTRTKIRWQREANHRKYVVQARYGKQWRTVRIIASKARGLNLPKADAIAVTALDAYGNASDPKVLGLD